MTSYTNAINIVSHVRRVRLGIPQASYIVDPWNLGCAFVLLQVSLNYILHEMPEKRLHAMTISL